MKRLFVLPGHHGRQVGRQLVQRLLEEGAALGYEVGPPGRLWCSATSPRCSWP